MRSPPGAIVVAVHAVVTLGSLLPEPFVCQICVKCKDLDELIELAKAAEKLQLPTFVIQDAGRTEVEPGTTTVLAIGPGAAPVMNEVTGHLKLLR